MFPTKDQSSIVIIEAMEGERRRERDREREGERETERESER